MQRRKRLFLRHEQKTLQGIPHRILYESRGPFFASLAVDEETAIESLTDGVLDLTLRQIDDQSRATVKGKLLRRSVDLQRARLTERDDNLRLVLAVGTNADSPSQLRHFKRLRW